MNEVEGKVLNMYDKSRPVEDDLFGTSNVNHFAWTLAAVFGALVIWLMIALVNAENQRFALMSKKCADPLFKGEIDQKCLVMVQSRDHWWEHLGYAMMHVRQSALKK